MLEGKTGKEICDLNNLSYLSKLKYLALKFFLQRKKKCDYLYSVHILLIYLFIVLLSYFIKNLLFQKRFLNLNFFKIFIHSVYFKFSMRVLLVTRRSVYFHLLKP